MSRKINLIIFLCFILCEVYAQYVPDVLGDGYLRRTFQMPDDYEGKVVCTLVKKPQLDSVKQAYKAAMPIAENICASFGNFLRINSSASNTTPRDTT